MPIPSHIIVNADDLGLNPSVNKAILYCFEQQYINSTSLLTNMDGFTEAVELVHNNPIVKNIGVHVNFAEGKPLTNFTQPGFTDEQGSWDLAKTGRSFNILSAEATKAFATELNAQIEKALSANINITHLDAHLHLHTLPAFYNMFIEAARYYSLKLRLAQTYREGSYLKFYYRKYLNYKIKKNKLNYTDLFETVDEFLKKQGPVLKTNTVEIMVHPDFNNAGELFDHVDKYAIINWIDYVNNFNGRAVNSKIT